MHPWPAPQPFEPAGPWGPAAHFSDRERACAAVIADAFWAAACTLLIATAVWSLLPA